MQTKANLQDIFLLRAKRDRLPVTMFLMNGFQTVSYTHLRAHETSV